MNLYCPQCVPCSEIPLYIVCSPNYITQLSGAKLCMEKNKTIIKRKKKTERDCIIFTLHGLFSVLVSVPGADPGFHKGGGGQGRYCAQSTCAKFSDYVHLH